MHHQTAVTANKNQTRCPRKTCLTRKCTVRRQLSRPRVGDRLDSGESRTFCLHSSLCGHRGRASPNLIKMRATKMLLNSSATFASNKEIYTFPKFPFLVNFSFKNQQMSDKNLLIDCDITWHQLLPLSRSTDAVSLMLEVKRWKFLQWKRGAIFPPCCKGCKMLQSLPAVWHHSRMNTFCVECL